MWFELVNRGAVRNGKPSSLQVNHVICTLVVIFMEFCVVSIVKISMINHEIALI